MQHGQVILDSRKKRKKIGRYNDLKYKVKSLWGCNRINVIPAIVGALGVILKSVEGWQENIGIKEDFTVLLKPCFLRTARTLRYASNS